MLHPTKTIFLLFFLTLFVYAKEIKPVDINLDTLSLQAKKETKHTLVFVHMTRCPYCQKMEKFTLHNKDIQKELKQNFQFVDINIDDDADVRYKNFFDSKREFAKYLAINFYPTVVFIDDDNKIVYLLKGYRTKEKFNNVLKYIKTKSYLDMNLETYLDELEFNKG